MGGESGAVKASGGLSEGGRHFLLLQGPCGPFFNDLQGALDGQGHRTTRIIFNGGDFMSSGSGRSILYRKSLDDWQSWLADLQAREGITDAICYGDCRPYHRKAIATLKPLGVDVHVLEEGYLRPHWVTLERDGVNGYSTLTAIDLGAIDEERLERQPAGDEASFTTSQWHYMLAGFTYYVWLMLLTPLFPRYVSHRELAVAGEGVLWFTRILRWPIRHSRTQRALSVLERLSKPLHLVLLQLNGDSQTKVHSGFQSSGQFVEHCVSEYAASGANEALLVFKNHPLDNGVINLAAVIRGAAIRHGVEGKVFFVETGKLVPLLEQAISVTSINSTACHQSLRRGIPTLVLGRAVFNHKEIVPRMRLADFFRLRPVFEPHFYGLFVRLLQATCQVHGGFYSHKARAAVLPGLTARLIRGSPAPESFLIQEDQEALPLRAS